MKTKYVHYYVEGENEKKLIDVLKSDLNMIRPGKAETLNVIQCELKSTHLRNLKPQTMVVLVFDTDTMHTDILKKNLERLKHCANVSEIVTIPQVKNLEEELIRACNIQTILELLGSQSRTDFKSDFIRATNLGAKLKRCEFDIRQFWSRTPTYPYTGIENQAHKIKLL